MPDRHWTEDAERITGSANPVWGHIGESPDGYLLLPAWKRHEADKHGCRTWWNRRLNLRRPTHWLPYLRSRLARQMAWLDE